MDVTRFAIENNRVTLVALALILLGGADAFFSLPQAEDPGFIVRTAMIQTAFPGAGPERVENLVTDKIEEAIQEMPELDFVSSESKTGLSVVYVNVKESYKDMRPIWDSMRRKVERAERNLPAGVWGPFVNDEFGDVFGIIIAITAGKTAAGAPEIGYADLKDIADQVRDRLLRLPDTAKVEIQGAQEERVFVEFSDTQLAELDLSVMQLQQALESRNIIIPGGAVTTTRERIELEPSGSFDRVEDLRRTVINLPGREDFLYLEDIAEIRRSYIDPPESKMHSRNRPALGLAISMKEDGNIVEFGHAVRDYVEQFNRQYPIGVDFELVAYQTEHVERKVDEFTANVAQAIGIVLAVMLVMLGLRTGLVVATLAPSAMLATLILMGFLDLTLNQMTLASLIIALGMLVDNAIVISESIMVEMAAGKDRVEAAVDSARELRIPLLTSSLTTSAAFLPIYLAESTTGEYTGVLFTVVTVTLLCSWVLALTVIPLMCVMFLKVEPGRQTFESLFYRLYRGGLLAALRFPLLTVAAVIGVFYFSLGGFAYIPNIFFPPSDKAMFTAEIESPPGTSIVRHDQVMRRIDDFIETELAGEGGDVASWSTFTGAGAPRFSLTHTPTPPTPEYGFILFNATSREVLPELIRKIEQFCTEQFPDVLARAQPMKLGAPIDSPIEVRLSSETEETLFRLAEEVKTKLASMPGTKSIDDNWGVRTKKIAVNINPARAKRSGVTHQDIALSLQSVLSGYNATDFREGEDVIPVTLRSAEAFRDGVGKLEGLNVFSQASGRSTPLRQVADLEVEWQPSKIYRRNRLKTVTVSADLEPSMTAVEVTNELIPWLTQAETQWPLGSVWELGGEYEGSIKANESIGAKMPIGILIIVLLLVGQFNSIRRPLIILLTIPLGLIGVIAGLILANSYFGFMTLLGVISLAGIVINNAIVLLDRIDIEITRNGLEPAQAVIESAQRRLRPILLTTATTVGGLIPLWLGGGPMWEPMAIAIIFGLAFATVLTLGVVPVLYALFFRVGFRGFRYAGPNVAS